METEGLVEEPDDFMSSVDFRQDLPPSYTENSPEEEHLLFMAQSFQRHFRLLYPDRRLLLLSPVNEYGIKKLVTTTLRPTMPGLADLYTWEQCAHFVSSYLTLQPLDPPTELPRSLRSPQAVLQSQRGSSLEYANLLCSLLLGLNYNAYCVSGYASKHVCELDRSQESCPIQEDVYTRPLLEPPDEGSVYNIRQEKQLHSNFLLKQEALLEQQDTRPQEEPERTPTPDPLWGLRVHFWVLVLAGSRNVERDFFIEPLTGNTHPPEHPSFLGVETLWNELNVYVNMQDCANGCQGLQWDPEDTTHWEPLVYGTTSKKQLQKEAQNRPESMRMGTQAEEDEINGPSYSYDMPLSWCNKIQITERDLEMIWPRGFKVTHFKHTLLENFIPCYCPDGVVTRVTRYSHPGREVKQVKEWFQNRADLLTERDTSGGFTTEIFRPGHSEQLIFHRFNTCAPEACPAPSAPGETPEREMRFGPFRVDGLVRRLEQGNQMTESFEKRRDFLFQRYVLFGEEPDPASAPQRTVSSPELMEETHRDSDNVMSGRPILKVVEQFHRNPSKAPGEDIAERVFLMAERRIEVTYYQEKDHVIPAKQTFDKPTESTSTMKAGDFTIDMVNTFQVEPTPQPVRLYRLNELLVKLMQEEQKTVTHVRMSQRSVQSMVQMRAEEENEHMLEPCPWTTSGTAHARLHRERVVLMGEELRWLEEQQKDLLAPVLMRLNGTTKLSPGQAQTVYQTCLQDFRNRMIQQAQFIQQRIEEDTRELEEKQLAYQKTKFSLDSTEDHPAYCAKMTRQIQVSRKRLLMHKECAPEKYKVLELQLRSDLRLGPHLHSK